MRREPIAHRLPRNVTRARRPLESEVLASIRLAAHLHGCVLWRNSVAGVASAGRHFAAGLPRGSADLIGITERGRFVALEVKRDEVEALRALASFQTHDLEQRRFLELVNASGGYGVITYSLDHAISHMSAARAGRPAPEALI